MYYKVTSETEKHWGFQYKDGLNVDTRNFEEGVNHVAGLHFSDIYGISKFFDCGIYVREVILPDDSDFKMVKRNNNQGWKANKIILGKKWDIEEFVRKHHQQLDWFYISGIRILSEDFIRTFKDDVNWNQISYHSWMLSEDFMREFKDRLNWHTLSYRQRMSENFMREFKDKIDWHMVSSYHQKLSEDFMREFKDKIDWYEISHQQKFSEDFAREFKKKLFLEAIPRCQKHFSKEFIAELEEYKRPCKIPYEPQITVEIKDNSKVKTCYLM